MDKKIIPPSGQIVKGFGDDLGFDGFDPDRIPSNGKINKGGNPIMGERIVIPSSGEIQKTRPDGSPLTDTLAPVIALGIPTPPKPPKLTSQIVIPPSGQITVTDTLPPVIGLTKIPASGQIMGGGFTPGNNYGDDPGIDEVRPARPGTVAGRNKMNKKNIPSSGQINK